MSARSYRSSVPLGVKTLAFLVGLDGVIAVLDGVGRLGIALPAALLLIALGALHLLLAYGFWTLEPAAYDVGMVVFAVAIVVDLLTGNVYAAGLTALNVVILHHYRGLFGRSTTGL